MHVAWLSIFLFLGAMLCAHAGTLYRWVDVNGVVHITDQKPSEKKEISDIVPFPYPELEPDAGPRDPDVPTQRHSKSEKSAVSVRLQAARDEAQDAQEKARAATEEAERLKQESERYREKWGTIARTRRSVSSKMILKQDAAEEAVQKAQRLTTIAREALEKEHKIENEMKNTPPPADTAAPESTKMDE